MQRKIQKQQIDEWLDSPVTEYFVKLMIGLHDLESENRSNFVLEDDPIRTHFVRARSDGSIYVLERLVASIKEKDLSDLEIGDTNDEQFGDIPDGRQGTH